MFIGIRRVAIPTINVGVAGTVTPPTAPDLVVETYTTPGETTTTVPATQVGRTPYTVMRVQSWAPGGGGGETDTEAGGVGGVGGYSEIRKTVALAEQHVVEVGAAGSGGSGGTESGAGGGGSGVTGVYQPTTGAGNEVLVSGGAAGGGGGNAEAAGAKGANGGGGVAPDGAGVSGFRPDPTETVNRNQHAVTFLTSNDVVGSSASAFNINVQAGNNRGIIAIVTAEHEDQATAVTGDGDSFTKVAGISSTASVGTSISMWVLKEVDLPASGNVSISVTQPSVTANVHVFQIDNWNQVTPTGGAADVSASDSATLVQSTVTPSDAGSVCIGGAGHSQTSNFNPIGGTGTWTEVVDGDANGMSYLTGFQYSNATSNLTFQATKGGSNARMVALNCSYTGADTEAGNGGGGATAVAGGAAGTGTNDGAAGAARSGGNGADGDGTQQVATGGSGGSVGGGDGGDAATSTGVSGAGAGGGGSGFYGGGGGGAGGAGGGAGGGGGSGFVPAAGTVYGETGTTVPATSEANYSGSAGASGAAGASGGTGRVVVTYCGEFQNGPSSITNQNLVAWYRNGLGFDVRERIVNAWNDQEGNHDLAGVNSVDYVEADRGAQGNGTDESLDSASTIQSMFGNNRFSIFLKCSGRMAFGGSTGTPTFEVKHGTFDYAADSLTWTASIARRSLVFVHDGTNLIVRQAGAQVGSVASSLNALTGAAIWQLLATNGVFEDGVLEQMYVFTHPTQSLTSQEVLDMEAFLDEGICPTP